MFCRLIVTFNDTNSYCSELIYFPVLLELSSKNFQPFKARTLSYLSSSCLENPGYSSNSSVMYHNKLSLRQFLCESSVFCGSFFGLMKTLTLASSDLRIWDPGVESQPSNLNGKLENLISKQVTPSIVVC